MIHQKKRYDSNRLINSRREFLCRSANGFGGLALAALLAKQGGVSATTNSTKGPMTPRAPHFKAKAKSVIFLYMDGGPSQVDTFDPKPRLHRENGQPIKMNTPTTVFNSSNLVWASPFKFSRYGESGTPVSELFPNVANCIDDIAIIRSMVANHSEHTAGNFFMHSGSGFQGRPSMGSWVTYGLGSECDNLPGFVVMESGLIPPGGLDLFGSGFLPASYQGTLFRRGKHPVADVKPREKTSRAQRNKLELLRQFNRGVLDRFGAVNELEATVSNYELAFHMQAAIPDLIDLTTESETTRKLYGLDEHSTEDFGRQCLLARRMVERGVRFVELINPRRQSDRWDQHDKLIEGHRLNALAVDKPIAGLIKDLKSRGLLDSTLVVWGGEFGRTPTAQMDLNPKKMDLSTVGRDHNPFGFTMWMAGGGVKGGVVYGSTDEYGYFAIENKVHVHDLHATMLHLLGLDHEKLTFRFSGRDMRLTDVHGNVIQDLLS
ncbi:MAG: sulfatase [Solibacterales bacterium]|nr:sulfatase [Bryobacterales bacterium]